MSCATEKLRQLYERFGSEHLEVISQARSHAYQCSIGNGIDITEKQMFKPEYENKTAERKSPYSTASKSYTFSPMANYDFAPAKMPGFQPIYTKAEKEKDIDPKINMLEELIMKAKEDSRWMSTTQ